MSYAFSTGRELIALCEKENLTIAEVMIRREAETSEKTRDELVNEMFENLLTMQKSIRFGLEENQQTVTGLAGGNAEKLIQRIKGGEHFDFVEVMACPGGCINGAGQPFVHKAEKQARSNGLYDADRMCSIKSSEENPLIESLYNGILKGREHELLHVEYNK